MYKILKTFDQVLICMGTHTVESIISSRYLYSVKFLTNYEEEDRLICMNEHREMINNMAESMRKNVMLTYDNDFVRASFA